MPTVNPDRERLPDILADIPGDTPIVMLNLLRFREIARYKNGDADYSGREAYHYYLKVAVRKVDGVGGELIWSGDATASVIAPPDEIWDEVVLVRYPSIAAFQTMLADPEYQQATRHRSAALADSRLIAMQEHEHSEPPASRGHG